jgi:phosphoglycerate kinase
MNSINSISFKGKRVLLRVDFNVPLDGDMNIIDNTRIKAAIPTIKKILSTGGRLILITHLGRPIDKKDLRFSTKPIVKELSLLLNQNVFFFPDCIGDGVQEKVLSIGDGEVVLLENLRFYKEEREGEVSFSKKLASLADVYVGDAFGVSHRAHASNSIVPTFFKNKRFMGFLMEKELESLCSITKNPLSPFTAIIGGVKVSDKIGVLLSILDKIDNLIIGGAMAYTFVSYFKGSVGSSLVEKNQEKTIKDICCAAKKNNVQLILPIDSVNAKENSASSPVCVSDIKNIPSGYMGLDIGEKSLSLFSKVIAGSSTIMWNGPMGVFEKVAFENGTRGVARAIVNATKSGSFSFVGGGDSISALKKFDLFNDVSYVSTGGGAMFSYLQGKEMPGIKSLS